jgi:hypothetical protein
MATDTRTATGIETESIDWGRAAVAGVVATVAFGALQHATGGSGAIRAAFPALYGLGPSLAVGWLVHLFHGAVLGVGYAAVVSAPPLRDRAAGLGGGVALGAAYGVVTTVALAWLLMPVWLGAVGFPQAPPVPNVGANSLVGHLVYGVVLGALYAAPIGRS